MLIRGRECFDDHSLYWLGIYRNVQITQNGFFFYSSPVRQPDSHPCARTLGALCHHEANYTFMPCTQDPRTRLTDAPPPFDAFWRNETRCGKRASLYAFDITPCDLQHGEVIVWSDNRVAVKHGLDLDPWSNFFVMIITGWLIINMGESIALMLATEGANATNHNTMVLCLLLLSIILGKTVDVWASENDVILFWSTVAYIGLYTLYHIQNPHPINIVVGCMMLVSSRYYLTNETPYTITYLFILATRCTQKAFRCKGSLLENLPRILFMALDVALFTMLYILAYIPMIHNPAQAHLHLIGLLHSAMCLGTFIAQFTHP